ncbi:chorismate mutase [bacterium]|nr:chorismate mutase [bacterium]
MSFTKGIRGAITVENNTVKAIELATNELLTEIIKVNNIKPEKISHVIFTTTNDLNADFPAKFARINYGWDKVAMMCFHELDVPNSLPKCLRILIVLNCDETFEPKFIYLKGAKQLRNSIT